MNKASIKNFAVWARRKLIADITYKAGLLGITESGIAEELPQSTTDLQFFDIGTKNYTEVSGSDIAKRNALVASIKKKEKDIGNYKDAFQYVVEEVAYTWFNRLIAIRFMEINEYLPSGIRVLSSDSRAKIEPDIVTNPFDTDLEFTPYEQDRIIQLKDESKLDELFRILFIKQCNKLNEILPELFEKTDDFTEILLTLSFTDKDGIVYKLTHDIDEDDFNIEKEGQIEIIGWMYQYYNIEPKAAVFAKAGGTKIKKEDIPAATQLFTPDWIVRYLVENSVGRIWIEGHQNDSLRNSWIYYIDEAQQEPDVLDKLNEIYSAYKSIIPEKIKVIDPCMGSGHILVYAFDVLMQIYESYGYTQRDAARSILLNNIFGLDIDKRAYQLAYFAVMMKARQYNRRILTEHLEPNLAYTQNVEMLETSAINRMGDYREQTLKLFEEFRYVAEYGSILNVSLSISDLESMEQQLEEVVKAKDYGNVMDILECDVLVSTIKPVIKQAKILVQKYEVVVTNPPYLAGSAVDSKLNEYIKNCYPASKADLFAVFIERCKEMLAKNGFQAMITMHSWMFLSSYEKLREKMMESDLVNMVHLGARAFEEISGEVVQTTAFVIRKSRIEDYLGTYCRLVEPNSQNGKEELFLKGTNRYISDQRNFTKIPGAPIAYWVSEAIYTMFNMENLMKYFDVKAGICTGD
ncbi:MAG: BREX-1 system adenine-specific DNA-methyltransferase PglX, partial [Ruminococcus flavefaciens]|nr:BREX-1 system adenine-specific DNA-methyltransferase PglX [Ruminococcus flavefaciens]